MKQKIVFGAMKNLLCCLAIILPIQFTSNLDTVRDNLSGISIKKETKQKDIDKVVLLSLDKDYCDARCYLNENEKTVSFITKTFGVNKELVVEKLVEINSQGKYDINNIGRLTDSNGALINYGSFERGLIEYMFKYVEEYPQNVDNTHVPYTGSREYVENLIKYFTKYYPEVDYLTVISIGAAESGYYTASGMLSVNNVYGGMGNGGLIRYKNIEYGILSYVRYLANYYYSQGLNTVESIGYKYCPSIDANGNKVTSPHWLSLVYRAKGVYANTNNDIKVDALVD